MTAGISRNVDKPSIEETMVSVYKKHSRQNCRRINKIHFPIVIIPLESTGPCWHGFRYRVYKELKEVVWENYSVYSY